MPLEYQLNWSNKTDTKFSQFNNIKHRSFGGIGQVNYTLPDETAQIKMDYDSRLRVNHSEVLTNKVTGGYLMKADFSYSADSRLQAKNDWLDDKWDRTNKYDYAGRLTFNQFGLGLAVDGVTYKRVYQESLTYDGFSLMNSRSTTHWGNDSVFFETYTNGRITNNPTLQYDATGNIVSSTPNSQNPHVFQKFDFDASGRRIGSHDSEKGRWGSILNMVTEKKDVIAFDGDGHPVVEKSGYQTYHAVTGTPPPAGWQPPIRSYQIWSTVLGGSLMTYHPANDYRAVNVYAGGAVIAEKTRGAENNQTVEHLGWKTSDPVTGTQAVFNQYGAVKLEEIEPLGQAIAFHDSSAPPEPSPNQVPERRNADDPHWQCEADKGFWGGITGYPFHCQKKMIQDLDYELKNLFGWGKRVENPARINYLTDSPLPSYGMPHSAADNLMAFALRATTKKTGIEGGSSDGCKFDKNGNKTCGVNVPIPPLDMSVIPGFNDSTFGRSGDAFVRGFTDRQLGMLSEQLTFMANENCAKAFRDAGLETPEEQINNGIVIMSEDFLGNSLNDSQWSPDKGFAKKMRKKRNLASNTNDVTQIGPYNGKRYMALTGRAFNEVDDFFSVTVVHSFIHSAGKAPSMEALWTESVTNISTKTGKALPFPPSKVDILPLHDLEWFGDNYNKIIENCTPQGKSRIGPARVKK